MQANLPTYLTCPFCPSQAYPSKYTLDWLREYKCPANHTFYINTKDEEKKGNS